jgi:hypothetical protein
MPLETEITRTTGYFHEREPRSIFSSVLRDTALLDDNCFVTPSANVREVALLSDAYEQSAYSVLHDTALISGTALPSLLYVVNTRDVFLISDVMSSRNVASVDVREDAVILGYANAPPSATLREVARLNDALSWFSTGVQTLREVGRLSDAVYPHVSVVLREVGQLGDAISSHLRNVALVREVALLNEIVTPRVYARGVGTSLRDVFYASDRASIVVTWAGGGALLHEIGYFDDRALPPPTGRAYTCHILNWGLSVYANYPFTTQAGNFAAGQNLWRLDAPDDYGVPIRSWVKTGMLDIGTSHGKRPSALYAAGSSLAPLTVTVFGDVNGAYQSFDYALELRDQTNYRNNRTFLGKGFRSRYLQFKLGVPKYTAMRLLTAEVDLAASPRRVG